MTRYINTLFRHWKILIIPLILMPAVMVALGLNAKPKYTATASLFVEQPLYLNQVDVVDGPVFTSPAQKQAGFLQELMSSRTFLAKVIDRTSLKGSLEDETKKVKVYTFLGTLGINSESWNTIGLSLEDETPDISKEVLGAIVDQYFQVLDDRSKNQVASALVFYKKRVEEAKKTYDTAEAQVKAYLADNSGKIGSPTQPDGTTRGLSQEDLEFARLGLVRDTAQRDYQQLRDELDKIEFAYAGYQENRQNNFRIQDPPQEEQVKDAKSRIVLINGVIGLVGGALLLVVGVLFLTWIDPSFRERASVVRMLSLPSIVVQDVPMIRSKRVNKKKGGISFDLRRTLVDQLGWKESGSRPRLESPKLETEGNNG